MDTPESSVTPTVARKLRSQGAYWTAGAIAAGILIGILWFRFQALPGANEVASTGALPTPTTLAHPETSPAVVVGRQSLADNSTVESGTAVDADETASPAASDSVVAVQQTPAQGAFGASRANGAMLIGDTASIEDWGQVMTHFMNPFSYLRIASQVMGSVMQAWGVIPQQPTQQ